MLQPGQPAHQPLRILDAGREEEQAAGLEAFVESVFQSSAESGSPDQRCWWWRHIVLLNADTSTFHQALLHLADFPFQHGRRLPTDWARDPAEVGAVGCVDNGFDAIVTKDMVAVEQGLLVLGGIVELGADGTLLLRLVLL